MRYRIGVEGVASMVEVLVGTGGVLGGPDFVVSRAVLLQGLQRRFDATEEEARFAIRRAAEVGAVVVDETRDTVSLVRG